MKKNDFYKDSEGTSSLSSGNPAWGMKVECQDSTQFLSETKWQSMGLEPPPSVGLLSEEPILFGGQEAESFVQSGDQFREVFKDSTDAIILTDPRDQGKILSANPAACQMLGWTEEELVGQPWNTIFDSEAPHITTSSKNDIDSNSNPTVLTHWRKDGTTFSGEVSIAFFFDSEGEPRQVAVIRDITERSRAQEEIRHQKAILNGINRILNEALTCENEQDLGSLCLRIARELTQSETGFIAEIDPDGFLINTAISPDMVSEIPGGMNLKKFTERFEVHGILGRVIISGKPLFTNDIGLQADIFEWLGSNLTINSFLGAPLVQGGNVMGIIGLCNRKGGYSNREKETLEVLTHAMGQVIMRKRVEVKLREIEENVGDILQGVSRLQELGTRLVRAGDLNSLLKETLSVSAELCGAPKGYIQFVDPKTGSLEIIAHQGFGPLFVEHFSKKGCAATCIAAKRQMRRVIIEDITQEPSLKGTSDLAVFLAEGIRAIQSTPLVNCNGHLVGVLSNHFSTPYNPTENQLRFLDLLARMAADFIERKQAQEILKTDREQLEDLVQERTWKLNESNRKLVQTVESITDVFFSLDREWRVTYWNKAAEKMFNLKREEILGRNCWEVFPQAVGTDCFNQYHNALSENRSVSFVTYVTYTNRWVEVRAYPSEEGLTIYMNDITGRKMAEEELKKSRAELEAQARFFDAMLSNTSDIVATWNRDKEFIYANRSMERVLGLQKNEFIRKTIANVGLEPKVSKLLSRQIDQVFETQEPVKDEVFFTSPTGEICCWEYIFSPLQGVDGKTRFVIGVARDTMERRRAEKEIDRLERLNLIGEMAASIGHEIRNPMTTIRGFLQIVNEREDNERFKNYYKLMIEELDRANSIITEYLSMAKDKSVNIKPGNLNSIIETIYPMIQADASYSDKQVKLELGSLPELLIDEKEIRQLIINLVRNGLEAMEPEGVLTIRTRVDGEDGILEVEDQGRGIPPEVLEKIGTPFTTTKDNGTGLGLAVCYSIAHRHKAKIEVATGGTGTTFTVRFPIPDSLNDGKAS